MSDLFAPAGGWRVRIRDNSMPSEENTLEEIGGFTTLMQANAFARRYVRDSVERCRVAAGHGDDVLKAWFSWGEDAEVIDAGEAGWHSANELAAFTARPAAPEERDWRALDPRRLHETEEE